MMSCLLSQRRTLSMREVSQRWRSATGTIASASAVRFSATGSGPGADVAGVSVELSHRHDDTLQAASDALSSTLASYDGVVDIENSFASGSQQITLALRPTGKSMGLNEKELIRQVRYAFNGVRAMRLQRGSDEVDIVVQLRSRERSSIFHLEPLPIKVGNEYLPLAQVATLTQTESASHIQRRNGHRRVTVSADITPSSEAMAFSQNLAKNVFPELRAQYPGLIVRFAGDQAEQKESLTSLAVNGALVLLALYCLLAIPFQSYSQPLIIMTIIPFGIIGAVVGHILLGHTLSVVSLLGILFATLVTLVLLPCSYLILDDIRQRGHKIASVPINP